MKDLLELYLAGMCALGLVMGALVAALLPFATIGYVIWRLI